MNPENNNSEQPQQPPVQPASPAPENRETSTKGNNTIMAILCYLGILILVPFLTEAKNDPFVKFHMKQGLALIISFVAGWIIGTVPILGWAVGTIVCIFNVVMVVIGIINAASGTQKELPLIGQIARNFKF